MLELFSLSLAEMQGGSRQMSRHRGLALLRVKRFIANNLSDTGLDATAIASAVGLSVRYINNLFIEENTSLMRYLTRQRLERSRQYLASRLYQHLSITEIALQCGFNNMAHFSRIFHRAYGFSPRAYRHHCQNEP